MPEASNEIYKKLSEGLGGAYERIAYTNIIKRIAQKYNCKNILELNATYIAGIPGFNSCLLAQSGYNVTVAVTERDYEDTKEVWRLTGLKANIVKIKSDKATGFISGSFDLVYNHLAFDQYKDPVPLVREMKRLSNKIIMNLTLSPYNYGYWIHKISHKMYKQEWDHGYRELGTTQAMEDVHSQLGLKFVERGACDAPPWMDTVNAQIGESMTYLDAFPKAVRERWIWCSVDKKTQEHKLVKKFLSWEEAMPFWFKKFAAHHLYVVSSK
jgi:hypothetical protein